MYITSDNSPEFFRQNANQSEINHIQSPSNNYISPENRTIKSLLELKNKTNSKASESTKLAKVVGNPFVRCLIQTRKCYNAVEQLNTWTNSKDANEYCQNKYGHYPYSFASRAYPLPFLYCWSSGEYANTNINLLTSR